MRAPVIVTRPAATGQRLQQKLKAAGYDVQWWPAFEFGPAPDADKARATLARLADFDLAIFVSPQAVQAALSLLAAPWPAGTTIGAVGGATGTALRSSPLTAAAKIIEPIDDESGSEAFWSAWTTAGGRARRVLILRAPQGRAWLADRFAAAGAAVEILAVYTRNDAAAPDAATRAWLRHAIASGSAPTTIVSSSESVDALERQLAATAGAANWLKAGIALATHERIRDRLLDVGYTHVELSASDDDAILTRLESLGLPRSAGP